MFHFCLPYVFLLIKVFYLQKTSDSLERARDKIDAARRVYPSDARFARLFFRNEFALLKEGERPSPDVQRIADAFILLVPKYADADAELELYAALFSDGEKKIRLLKAYHAKELTHPLYAEASLKAGLMTQKEAVEYFVEWADVSISLEWLKSFAVLITEDEPVEFLREYLNSYEGLLTVDTDGDLEPNLFVDYYRGRPQNIQWDRNNDGINEWTAVCDFGVPTAVCIPADEITVNYGSFPYITKLAHKDSNGRNNDVRNLEWCTYKYNSNYGTIKQRLSKSLSGENNGMYGKVPANKGVPMSDEQKEKLRLSHLGNNKGRHWKLIDGKRVWYD